MSVTHPGPSLQQHHCLFSNLTLDWMKFVFESNLVLLVCTQAFCSTKSLYDYSLPFLLIYLLSFKVIVSRIPFFDTCGLCNLFHSSLTTFVRYMNHLKIPICRWLVGW